MQVDSLRHLARRWRAERSEKKPRDIGGSGSLSSKEDLNIIYDGMVGCRLSLGKSRDR